MHNVTEKENKVLLKITIVYFIYIYYYYYSLKMVRSFSASIIKTFVKQMHKPINVTFLNKAGGIIK